MELVVKWPKISKCTHFILSFKISNRVKSVLRRFGKRNNHFRQNIVIRMHQTEHRNMDGLRRKVLRRPGCQQEQKDNCRADDKSFCDYAQLLGTN